MNKNFHEIYAFLVYDVAYIGNYLLMFRDNPARPIFLYFLKLEDGTDMLPRRNYHYTT
jgi:hypothetical protein